MLKIITNNEFMIEFYETKIIFGLLQQKKLLEM